MPVVAITLLSAAILTDVQAAAISCKDGEHWVKAHRRRAYIRTDGVRFSASSVSAHCAANPEGYSKWAPLLKASSPQNWPLERERTTAWTEEEKEKVLEALATVPEGLWPPSIRGIYRLIRSNDYPNPSTSRPGEIVLYDTAFEPHRDLARILTHELAHEHFRNLSAEDKTSYYFATNWFEFTDEKGRSVLVSRQRGFVKPDGRTSPAEDFANNIESYVFEPKALLQATPHAYGWIKSHFGDKLNLKSSSRGSGKGKK